jgi:hypothetical protein
MEIHKKEIVKLLTPYFNIRNRSDNAYQLPEFREAVGMIVTRVHTYISEQHSRCIKIQDRTFYGHKQTIVGKKQYKH